MIFHCYHVINKSLHHHLFPDLHNCLINYFFNFISLLIMKHPLLQYICFSGYKGKSKSPKYFYLLTTTLFVNHFNQVILDGFLSELCYYQYGQTVSFVKVVVLICIIKSYTCIITIYTIKSSF